MNKSISVLCGVFIYVFVISVFTRQVVVYADELEENIEEVKEQEEDYIEHLEQMEEISEDSFKVLSDDISEDSPVLTDRTENISHYSLVEEVEDPSPDEVEDPNEDIESQGDIMNEDQFRIMVIFGLGIIVGCLVGNTIVGFIK